MSQPKRGHHVINLNVLKVFRNIIDGFLKEKNLTFAYLEGKLKGSHVYQVYYHPTDAATENFVTNAVVHYQGGPGRNDEEWGRASQNLHKMSVLYMNAIYKGNYENTRNLERSIKQYILEITDGNLFVDEDALKEWLQRQGNALVDFNNAKRKVKWPLYIFIILFSNIFKTLI